MKKSKPRFTPLNYLPNGIKGGAAYQGIYYKRVKIARLDREWQRTVGRYLGGLSYVSGIKSGVLQISVPLPEHPDHFQPDAPYYLELFKKLNPIHGKPIKTIEFCLPQKKEQVFSSPPFLLKPNLNPSGEIQGESLKDKILRVAQKGEEIAKKYHDLGYKKCPDCFSFFEETGCSFCYNKVKARIQEIMSLYPWISFLTLKKWEARSSPILFSQQKERMLQDLFGEIEVIRHKLQLRLDPGSELDLTLKWGESRNSGNPKKFKKKKKGEPNPDHPDHKDNLTLSLRENLNLFIMLKDGFSPEMLKELRLETYPFPDSIHWVKGFLTQF